MSDLATEALERMERSVRHDAREIFFALWADRVGVDWDALSDMDRSLIMTRLGYLWYRAISR